jgi:hypothetical protein
VTGSPKSHVYTQYPDPQPDRAGLPSPTKLTLNRSKVISIVYLMVVLSLASKLASSPNYVHICTRVSVRASIQGLIKRSSHGYLYARRYDLQVKLSIGNFARLLYNPGNTVRIGIIWSSISVHWLLDPSRHVGRLSCPESNTSMAV